MNPKNKIRIIHWRDPNWSLKWVDKDWLSYNNLLDGKIDKSNYGKKANSENSLLLFKIIMFRMIPIKF